MEWIAEYLVGNIVGALFGAGVGYMITRWWHTKAEVRMAERHEESMVYMKSLADEMRKHIQASGPKPNGLPPVDTKPMGPNITLTEAWTRRTDYAHDTDCLESVGVDFMAAVFDGRVAVWARMQQESGNLRNVDRPTFMGETEIPAEYWQNGSVVTWLSIHGTERTFSPPTEQTYGKLRFNAKQLLNAKLIRYLNPNEDTP